MKKFTVWDIIISAVAIAVVCAAIVPAVARLQRTPEDAICQANMRRWAGAVELYTSDWNGRYPTNRLKPSMFMVPQAFLSPKEYDQNGNPIRFVYGINWVEALYPYIIDDAKRTGRDWESFMRCPAASDAKYPSKSMTARMTYTFNYNLLEQPTAFNRNRARLMMMREMDRLMEAVCRPVNNSTGSPDAAPMSPFLTERDYMIRGVVLNNKLHGQGSHILFADGHVQYFGIEYFPATLNSSANWDSETQQWWNWVNKDTKINKAIAITP